MMNAHRSFINCSSGGCSITSLEIPVPRYAHAQLHPGGMTAEGIGMGRWEF